MALTQVQGAMVGPTGFANLSGITFPATQVPSADANTLDDYEEGTWTPTNTQGVSMSSTSSTYQKIGNTVFLNAFIDIGANANGNTFVITGMPFALTGVASGASFNNASTDLYTYMDGTGIFIRTNGNGSLTCAQLSSKFVGVQLFYRVPT